MFPRPKEREWQAAGINLFVHFPTPVVSCTLLGGAWIRHFLGQGIAVT